MRRVVLLRVLAVLGLAAGLAALPAHAAIIDFQLSADDYAKLKIDGSDIALVDTYPGGVDLASVDLTPGLHDIELLFANRWGSSWLSLWWKSPTETTYTIIPKDHLFSLDASGSQINGLRADYTSAQFTDFTIYGEGPIWHARDAFGDGGTYEGVSGVLWAHRLSGWEVFQESLTGQILVEPTSTPEPSALAVWSLMGIVGLALGLCRKRKVR